MTVLKTYCGLDIGSNTFSFTELAISNHTVEIINDLSLGIRLSEGLAPGGPLSPAAVKRGLDAVERLTAEFDLRRKPLRVVATAALRKTGDPTPFTRPAEVVLGTPIEIITGDLEAALTSRGAVIGIPGDGPFAMVDIGGQSTEVAWQNPAGQWEAKSLPLGVVDLTERFVAADPPSADEIDAMSGEVHRILEAQVPHNAGGTLLGVAGTATSLAMLHLGLTEWRREKVHGLVMSMETLRHWQQRMIEVTAKARTERYGVRPIRADVFPAGLCIQEAVLAHFGLDAFTVSVNGLRVGAALSLLD